MRIVIKTITEGEAGDVRSDSELSDKEDTREQLTKVSSARNLVYMVLKISTLESEQVACRN